MLLGLHHDGLTDALVEPAEDVAPEGDLVDPARHASLDDALMDRPSDGSDARDARRVPVDRAVREGDSRERAHVAVGGEQVGHLRLERWRVRVAGERLRGVRVTDEHVPVPALLARGVDEVTKADAERHGRDHAGHRDELPRAARHRTRAPPWPDRHAEPRSGRGTEAEAGDGSA